MIGIDIAAPEKHAFTADGMANFEELYRTVAAAAAERGRPLVLRPHVGEGYNEGNGQAHEKLAHQNLETLITALEKMGYSAGRGDKDGVIIRFGHATHAKAEQVQRMAKLGVIVEANIGSNVTTGSIKNISEHPLLLNLYYGVRTVLGTDGGCDGDDS
ncbi:MAG: hypothetical protein IPQ07_09395 [Myxococcales bacterium]|nr:hypothetical protein [Myxococcales bacterium]